MVEPHCGDVPFRWITPRPRGNMGYLDSHDHTDLDGPLWLCRHRCARPGGNAGGLRPRPPAPRAHSPPLKLSGASPLPTPQHRPHLDLHRHTPHRLARTRQQPRHRPDRRRRQRPLPTPQHRPDLGLHRHTPHRLEAAGRQRRDGTGHGRRRAPLPAAQHRPDLDLHRVILHHGKD
jgi:hypothetical protein